MSKRKVNAKINQNKIWTKHTERLIYLFILPRNEGLSQKIKTEYADTLNGIRDSLQEENNKRIITLRLVFWISLTTHCLQLIILMYFAM